MQTMSLVITLHRTIALKMHWLTNALSKDFSLSDVHFTFSSPIRANVECCGMLQKTDFTFAFFPSPFAAAPAASLASYRFSSTSFSTLSKLMTFLSPSFHSPLPSICSFLYFAPGVSGIVLVKVLNMYTQDFLIVGLLLTYHVLLI